MFVPLLEFTVITGFNVFFRAGLQLEKQVSELSENREEEEEEEKDEEVAADEDEDG